MNTTKLEGSEKHIDEEMNTKLIRIKALEEAKAVIELEKLNECLKKAEKTVLDYPENDEKWDEKIQKIIDNRIAVERLAIELGFEQCPSCHQYYENTDNWHYNGDSYVCPKCDR